VFHHIEIKGKDLNTWVSLKINSLHSNPGFGTRKQEGGSHSMAGPLFLPAVPLPGDSSWLVRILQFTL